MSVGKDNKETKTAGVCRSAPFGAGGRSVADSAPKRHDAFDVRAFAAFAERMSPTEVARLAAELAALLPPLCPIPDFAAAIHASSRTVMRMEKAGLPVVRPSRKPLVVTRPGFEWILLGKPAPPRRGRPRNVDLKARQVMARRRPESEP